MGCDRHSVKETLETFALDRFSFSQEITTRVARATTVGTRILRVFLVFMIVVLSKLLELGEEVASVALGL